ncbi:MAG TPA: helix-hairpin-helix domain-containing protein [Flavisolibacter sp.]|jgi:DNA polymerase (family 10)|nr:helix-hairpin-helix domain-containing protein [Flavisolibacter sp.]
MDNYAIADQFSLLAKLMDIHGENAFRAKSYASAAFAIEKAPTELASLNEEQIAAIRGIGDSTAKKVKEILQTGELKALQDLLQKTPTGVLEMMNIKGLGPKKINIIWKEMKIDTIEALEKACQENRIAAKKGFGAKTEQKILESIAFASETKGHYLYKHVEDFALALQSKLEAKFPGERTAITGQFRRQLEIISQLEWVTTAGQRDVIDYLMNDQVEILTEGPKSLMIRVEERLKIQIHFATAETFVETLFATSASEAFLAALQNKTSWSGAQSEEAIFQNAGLPLIPPYLRESNTILEKANKETIDAIVETSTIKGLIHSHSNWSDGAYTIEQMAEELIRIGFEYMVISDHSKSAYYANGLNEEKIREQHVYIDSLNQKFAPFRIFKSIECDILGDGSLDYDNETLSTFDLVITSIHSNLDMDEEKAMQRLMGAITNPYTTILGHMTGRLLLRRKGYPVDHKAIIDACAANNVVIEINASPSRLDMDWRWVEYAMEKGVMLSINPDAHALEEFNYIKYGTLVAQKGALPASRNLSSFSLQAFENFLQENRRKREEKS